MPADELHRLRSEVESRHRITDAVIRQAVLGRIDDVVRDLVATDRALARLPHPDLPSAASSLAHVHYLTGHGWRRYLAEAGVEIPFVDAMTEAVRRDSGAFAAQLAVAVRASAPALEHRDETSYGVRCAVCTADAITFTVTRTGPDAPLQLVMTSLSPVTVFRPMAGPRMDDLLVLLARGDAGVVIRHLLDTHPAGCDAYCAQCDRTYCRAHCAVEARWSGSWHESTFATCPVGHVREIE